MKDEIKNCQNCKKDFTIEPDDFSFYEKIKVPAPTFCSECRTQRRFSWRNERCLYHNKCKITSKNVVSGFSIDSGINVYERDFWWSDKWDPISFGIDYDFSKPFFLQFCDFFHKTPMPSSFNARTFNSEYCQHTGEFKNGYLVHASWGGENVSYSARVSEVKDSMDALVLSNSELCYEVVNVNKCYNVKYSQNLESCNDSYFLFDCRGCSNCFCCVNLRNKSYCIFNEQYSREEYLEKLKEINVNNSINLKKVRDRFNDLKKQGLHRYANITNSPLCTGDNIVNSYNCTNCFDLYGDVRDCKFIQNCARYLKDSYDGYGVGASAELIYEVFDTGVQGSKLCLGAIIYGGYNMYYSYNCHGSKNCFACIGLRSKQYCILNRQYTKEQYEELVPKIIQHMNDMPYIDKRGRVYKYGEFFPSELSPFCYNETIAQEYFPLTKEQALDQGYKWKDKEERNYQIDIKNKDIPDNIKDITDDILGKIIECGHKGGCNQQCTEAFKIIPEELQFYQRMNLPLPRLCPNCRHYERLAQRNPLKLWHRSCMKEGCTNEFETSYAPERPEIIYCEKCYQQEVY